MGFQAHNPGAAALRAMRAPIGSTVGLWTYEGDDDATRTGQTWLGWHTAVGDPVASQFTPLQRHDAPGAGERILTDTDDTRIGHIRRSRRALRRLRSKYLASLRGEGAALTRDELDSIALHMLVTRGPEFKDG